MRDAVLAEIDPGESLRWCGQPLPSRMFRRALPAAIFGFGFCGFFAGLCFVLAAHTWHDLSDPSSAPIRKSGAADIGAMLVIGTLVLAVALGLLLSPWQAKARARRTAHGITNTRVFTLLRHTSGRVRVDAVEPGHPLAISRREHADGTGDIVLHPGPRPLLLLAATPDPRSVERLIRATFDPPAR